MKKQILPINCSPSQAIQQAYDAETLKYLGVIITKKWSNVFEANYFVSKPGRSKRDGKMVRTDSLVWE